MVSVDCTTLLSQSVLGAVTVWELLLDSQLLILEPTSTSLLTARSFDFIIILLHHMLFMVRTPEKETWTLR